MVIIDTKQKLNKTRIMKLMKHICKEKTVVICFLFLMVQWHLILIPENKHVVLTLKTEFLKTKTKIGHTPEINLLKKS